MSPVHSETPQKWRGFALGTASASDAQRRSCRSTTSKLRRHTAPSKLSVRDKKRKPHTWLSRDFSALHEPRHLSCERAVVKTRASPTVTPGKRAHYGRCIQKKCEEERPSALQEVIQAFDEADDEPSERDSGDSDFVDVPSAQTAVDSSGGDEYDDLVEETNDEGGDAGGRDSEDAEGNFDSAQDDTTFDTSLNLHQIAPNFGDMPNTEQTAQPETMLSVPILMEGLSTTYNSWKEFDDAFLQRQRRTFQLFSKRTSNSIAVRNKQIEKTSKESSAAGKRKRKDAKLLPEHWEFYSKTYKCTHAQSYKARGEGKRKHRKVRATNCGGKINVPVAATTEGSWELKISPSGCHNHLLTELPGITTQRTER